MKHSDFLVIGGGIVGVSIARELKQRHGDSSVLLLEKEAECGAHASGRNSGVLHAGFYYSPDSLKAQFTKRGNQALSAYCEQRRLPINRCGKLVVAASAADHGAMDVLIERGRANGIELQDISESDAIAIEPRARTVGRALFSPTTATVDPHAVMRAMTGDALAEGVQVARSVAFHGRKGRILLTSTGPLEAGYVVNAAGLQADRIAREFGFSERYRILPFKGLYLYSSEPAGAVRTNIYPVPDLRNPFLGVHVTVTAGGAMKIGPTAIPALWREQYGGFDNFSLAESVEVLGRMAGLMVTAGFDFRRLAVAEARKYSRRHLVSLASSVVRGLRPSQFTHWGAPGIRAQLIDIVARKLEMDFVVEGDDRSMHVLNAVSPGFTCAIPFAEHVCSQVDRHVSGVALQHPPSGDTIV